MAMLNRFAKEIENDKRYLQIYSQTRCEIKYRILKAYQNFFRRVKEKHNGKKQKAGFPRFKSRDRYYSIVYPQDNGSFRIEKERKTDMLRVSRIGRMKIELHRQMEGKIKTLTIKKDASQYYAVFTAIQEGEIPKIKDTNPVGIDVGLETFATLSDGTKIGKPQFARKKEKKLAKWQRILARRTRWEGKNKARTQSKNREKAKSHLAETWQEINNQTNDYLQKITTQLVNSGYTSFAVEDLHIQNMVKNHRLAGSIQDASWNRFIQLLSYKAESAGMSVVKVDARNTSKECSNCGNIQDMPLSERTYNCQRCGMSKDRDINASINILNRAREGHSRSNASGDATSMVQQAPQVASVNQEHTLQPMVAGEAHAL
jgi:putative transposase